MLKEQVRLFVNAVTLFLPRLSSEKLRDATDLADNSLVAFGRIKHPQKQLQVTALITRATLSCTDIHSHCLNSNYLLTTEGFFQDDWANLKIISVLAAREFELCKQQVEQGWNTYLSNR